MIEVLGISKRYQGSYAVNDLSFKIFPGKVTGFLGPNGSGKSTTMRLMLGLDKGSGKTLYDGKPLHNHRNPSAIVGILLEAKAFHPSRSATNHLKILAAASGVSNKRISEVLEIVGLQSVADKSPGKFSLGMSQRLGIAAAILSQPKYLLLDEPANGLDPEGIAWLRQFIKAYAAKGKGVFVSSHLLSEMSQMADNIIVIGKGKMIVNTTVNKIISGDAQASVFVRSTNQLKLAKLLKNNHLDYEKADGGFYIKGVTIEEVGAMVFKAGVVLVELTKHIASLEDAFLELTSDSQEFKAEKKKA